jgi:hypothetical protein
VEESANSLTAREMTVQYFFFSRRKRLVIFNKKRFMRSKIQPKYKKHLAMFLIPLSEEIELGLLFTKGLSRSPLPGLFPMLCSCGSQWVTGSN